MIKKINPNWYLVAGITLITLSHTSLSINFTAWIAYTPLLVYMLKTNGFKSRLMLFGALIIGWSLATAKIITPPLIYPFVFMYSVPIAIFHLPGFLLWNKFKNKKAAIYVFPLAMSLMEWIQYTFTPLASWGAAAYTQVDTPAIMQSLSLFGMPGLSFLIYWVNIAIAYFLIDKSQNLFTIKLLFIIVITVLIYGVVRINIYNFKPKETITVAAVGTDSNVSGLPLPSKSINEAVRDSLFSRTIRAAAFGAKLIVWNEASTFVLPNEEADWKQSLSKLCRKNKIALYAAYVIPFSQSPLKYKNKYLFVNTEGKIEFEYNKHKPVPGEPAMKGTEVLRVNQVEKTKVGGVICYDYDFPYLAKNLGKLNADIVAVPSSDWKGIDPVHTKMAAFRAIEQGHSIIRSTRFGLSAAINPVGDMVAKMSSFDKNNKIMVAQLPVTAVKTVYSMIGDFFIYLCTMFLMFIVLNSKKPI
jgi:apolipoprotein N-acyltransferase